MKLYSYFRSSAAFRVRIALALKSLPHEIVPIHMLRDGGHHRSEDYRRINPQMRIPAIALSSGDVLTQSLAIIEYLDEVYPDPPLLPVDALQRARVRAVAQTVACDIHPLNNACVLGYLRDPLGHGKDEVAAWYAHWIRIGFEAIETMVRPGPYAFGSHVTLADLCLVPQVFNARRFHVPIDDFPAIRAATDACMKLSAFERAQPDKQPDAE